MVIIKPHPLDLVRAFVSHTQIYATPTVYAGTAVQRLLEAVTEARKLEVEHGHQWKQTKHLLKYIKNQEREIVKTER